LIEIKKDYSRVRDDANTLGTILKACRAEPDTIKPLM